MSLKNVRKIRPMNIPSNMGARMSFSLARVEAGPGTSRHSCVEPCEPLPLSFTNPEELINYKGKG